jgi:hypothetical protein
MFDRYRDRFAHALMQRRMRMQDEPQMMQPPAAMPQRMPMRQLSPQQMPQRMPPQMMQPPTAMPQRMPPQILSEDDPRQTGYYR